MYEDSYIYAISKIEDGILKKEIQKFIKSYIPYTDKNKEEIAIEVNILLSNKIDEKKYVITYSTKYFNNFSLN